MAPGDLKMPCCMQKPSGTPVRAPGNCCIVRKNPAPDYIWIRLASPSFDHPALATVTEPPASMVGLFPQTALTTIVTRAWTPAPKQGKGPRAPPQA
jgi:hypothetical protein